MKLQEAIIKSGLTHREIATMLGVSRHTVDAWTTYKNGRRNHPRPVVGVKLAEILNIDFRDIYED